MHGAREGGPFRPSELLRPPAELGRLGQRHLPHALELHQRSCLGLQAAGFGEAAHHVVGQPVHGHHVGGAESTVGGTAGHAGLVAHEPLEGPEHALADVRLDQLHQAAQAGIHVLGHHDVDGVGGQPPPVIDGLGGIGAVVLPGALEHAAGQGFIDLAPVEHGDGQAALFAVLDGIQAVLHILVPGGGHIAAGDHVDLRVGEGMLGVEIHPGGPLQYHLGPGVHHPRAHGEGVDAGGHADDGIVRQVADVAGLGHGPGDHAHQELRLVDAQVVGAHPLPGGQQRAIQYPRLRMLHRCLHGRLQHHRRGGEDQRAVLGDQPLDFRLVLLRVLAHHGGGHHLVAQLVFQIDAAQVVPVDPAGVRGLAAVEEGHLHIGRAEQRGQQALALPVRLRLHDEGHVFGLLVLFKLGPQGADLLADHPVQLLRRVGIAAGIQIDQKGVARGDGQAVTALPRLVGRAEAHVGRLEVRQLLAGPRHPRRVARERIQLGEAARLRKPQVVDLRVVVKGQELVVDFVLGVLRAGRHHTGDLRLDGHGVQVFHHADALVALDQVVAVQVFERLHRLAQAVRHHAVVERLPLHGELAALVKQGHEVRCEGIGTPLGGRAHHLRQRHLNKPQGHAAQGVQRFLQLRQHRQKGTFVPLHPGMVFL